MSFVLFSCYSRSEASIGGKTCSLRSPVYRCDDVDDEHVLSVASGQNQTLIALWLKYFFRFFTVPLISPPIQVHSSFWLLFMQRLLFIYNEASPLSTCKCSLQICVSLQRIVLFLSALLSVSDRVLSAYWRWLVHLCYPSICPMSFYSYFFHCFLFQMYFSLKGFRQAVNKTYTISITSFHLYVGSFCNLIP